MRYIEHLSFLNLLTYSYRNMPPKRIRKYVDDDDESATINEDTVADDK